MVQTMDVSPIFTVQKHELAFNFPAGTSRGVLTTKKLWLITLSAEGKQGIGECSIIEGLSPEYTNDVQYEGKLSEVIHALNQASLSEAELLDSLDLLIPDLLYFPSIRFGVECALRSWLAPSHGLFFDNAFARGESAIQINGLIWMGAPEWMQDQVAKKIKEGYSVLKFKIGAIDWKQEHEIIQQVRKHFGPELLTIRVDANGGFTAANVRQILNQLRDLNVHSIEQPVAVNEIDLLAKLCKEAIVPIALDESLIPCYTLAEKVALLDRVGPQFIILKPSLHGGISGVQTWIELATARGIGWWMTSALESNIGLAAVAQFAAEYPLNLPQGLGTGGLFATNFTCGLSLSQDQLTHHLPVHG